MKKFFLAAIALSLSTLSPAEEYDIVIYGGTCAAVVSAVQAKKMGKSVVIVSPDKHLGGLSSGGLGWTDTGNKAVIGGLARDFYHRVWQYYEKEESWKWEEKSEYSGRGQGTPAIDGKNKTMWIFEPSIAEKVFEDYVAEFEIEVVRDEWLDRADGVELEDGKISSITTLSGKKFSGKVFLDTTYEGDLLAAAGVDYHVGRESNATYGEEWNGVQTGVDHHHHHFQKLDRPVSPYRDPADPESGVLPRISTEDPGVKGEGDHRVQAYCFRMCLTDVKENQIPFTAPEGYDPDQYELLVRCFEAGWGMEVFNKFDPLPNNKTDTNNHGPFSFDNIGYNYDYPEASYEERRAIIAEHETYQKGLLYFIATDPRVPADVQAEMNRWGLPKDEFQDNGNWSHQLYIREARRMVGDFVMTGRELRKLEETPDSIGMGSYSIDSHNVQRHIDENGHVQNEGDIGVSTRGPYAIAYGSLTPKAAQCTNLLVPVCVSSSHIAFGSIRMEPVFMILGQSAATAASIAIDEGITVQEVNYEDLQTRLLADGQILEYDGPIGGGKGIPAATLDGIVIDDEYAVRVGTWKSSLSAPSFIGHNYRHDENADKGKSTAAFTTELEPEQKYELFVRFPANKNRASNVPVTVSHGGEEQTFTLDQRVESKEPLGQFEVNGEVTVTVSNAGTDGYVIVDAIQWVPVE